MDELEKLYGQYGVTPYVKHLRFHEVHSHMLRNKRSSTWFEKRWEEYRILIREVYDEFHQVLGAEKLCTILVQRSHRVSKKSVADLMREIGLISVRTSSKQDWLQWNKPKKNAVRQQLQVTHPSHTWVSDVTCFKLNERYYLTCIPAWLLLIKFSKRTAPS